MSSRENVNRVYGIEYLHEKAEESRHDETLAYLMFVAGAIFFVGGILETVITNENPDWFLIFPYEITPHVYSLLGLSMLFSGFSLLVLGIVFGIHYTLDRAAYMNQLKETYANASEKWNRPSASSEPRNLSIKQPKTKKTNEVKECTKYLMEKQGLSATDAYNYCEMLGSQWRGLIKSSDET